MRAHIKNLKSVIIRLQKIVKQMEEDEEKRPDPLQGTLFEVFNEEEKITETKIFNTMGVYI